MLTQLYIQNIAVIQKASIDLAPGLNVFTGETGAGKTILISAIDAVLGERTSRDIIRAGEEKATVSAMFENISARAREMLASLGYPDEDGSVLITREMTASGKNTCRINGRPATVSILRDLSSLLLHIHGQRDSQQLFASERHVELIDAFGELQPLLSQYREAYARMRKLQEELDALQMDEAQKAQRMDMLRFQIDEIEAAGLDDPEEEEQLQAQRKRIRNSEKIVESLSAAYTALQGDGEAQGILEQFDVLLDGVRTAAEYMEHLEPVAARLQEMSYELAEYAGDLHASLDEFDYSPGELDAVERRLDVIYRLKRKYGPDIAAIVAFGEQAAAELEGIATSEQRAQQLEAELKAATATARKLAGVLSEKRLAAAGEFIRRVEDELAFLDMPSVKLFISHTQKALSAAGLDDLSLLIVTNVGETPKPLSKIASGGEIARIMLAMKNVLADRDDIDTLIFDEVDTGVSGRAAQKIGRKLKQVSHKRQVICVTHLAQVAAYADNHLLIHKEIAAGRTFTRVKTLAHDEAIAELARITSGERITDIALQNAEELWRHAQTTA